MAAVTTTEQRLVYFLFLAFVIFERSCSQWQEINSEKFYSTTVKFSVSQELIYRPNFSTQIGTKKKISRDSAACVWQIQPTSSQSLKFINLVSHVIFINVLLQCNDISLNPGPNQRGLLCQFCNKHIGRSQENAQYSKCNLYYHLRCLDTEYE